MEKLIYINELNESIELSYSRPFILSNYEGLDGIKSNLHTQKSPFQDGKTLVGKDLDSRAIKIDGYIFANNKAEYIACRNRLLKVFNPKLSGKLIFDNEDIIKQIDCEVEYAPVFSEKGIFDCKFLINLYCPNPYLKDIIESKSEIALWQGDFQFELEIPLEGIEMGHREPSLIVNVLNYGDVECGMKIEFKALATVVNPSILNVETQEYIKINKTMVSGEVITVTTGFGSKRVESRLNGVVTNAFNFIDLNSSFLQLSVGDNLFRYDAEQNLDNLEVNIYFNPQYLGV